MKRTIMSLKLELITQEENREKVLDEMTGNLEGSQVVVNACSGEVFVNECIGGQATYISETDGYEEEVLYDIENDKLEYQFLEVSRGKLKLGDVLILNPKESSKQFMTINIGKHFFLHNGLMNMSIAHEYNFIKLEELQRYVEKTFPEYKIYKHV